MKCSSYSRSGNFHNSRERIFAVSFHPRKSLTVDCYKVDERLEIEFLVFSLLPGIGGEGGRYHWLYIVIDLTFTSGGVDLRTHT